MISSSTDDMRQGPLLVAIVIAVFGLTSVAAASPETTESSTSSNPFAWLQVISLILSPIILTLIAVLGVWRLPPSARISAWRIPLEIGALAFASSILLQGLGIWTAMSMFGPASESATLRQSGLSVLGGYLGSSIPLVIIGVLWTQLPRPIGSERPLPLPPSLLIGIGVMIVCLPVVESMSSLGNQLQRWIEGGEHEPIGHETLQVLVQSSRDVWWWIIAGGAVLLAPVVEEILYRGIVQQSLRRLKINRWSAILLTSGLFALMHIAVLPDSTMIAGIMALFTVSMIFGWIREQTGRLVAPILAHMVFNAVNLVLALAFTA